MSWLTDFLWRLLPWRLRTAECTHFAAAAFVDAADVTGCEECLKFGGEWVHLRRCMICGKVGCCDQSPNTHATKHYQETGHPIVRSVEPDESWGWCYLDEIFNPDVEAVR